MPYTTPGMGGLVKDSLVVRSDGRVELDGEPIGWIAHLQIAPRYEYAAGRSQTEQHEISFSILVTPQKHEPDAVHDLAGRIVGYHKPDGTVELVASGGRAGA